MSNIRWVPLSERIERELNSQEQANQVAQRWQPNGLMTQPISSVGIPQSNITVTSPTIEIQPINREGNTIAAPVTASPMNLPTRAQTSGVQSGTPLLQTAASQNTPTATPTQLETDVTPTYKKKSWAETAFGLLNKPLEWVNEHIEEPVVRALSGKSEEEYDIWKKEHPLASGIAEFAVTLPLSLIPYGGLSLVGGKAIATAAKAAGLVRTAKVVENLSKVVPAAEKILNYPIEKPLQMMGKGIVAATTEKVTLKVTQSLDDDIAIGAFTMPSIKKLTETGFDTVTAKRLTERYSKVPLIKWVVEKIDPSVLAYKPEAQYTIAYWRQQEIGDSAARLLISPILDEKIGDPIKIFGIDELGFCRSVKRKKGEINPLAGYKLEDLMPRDVASSGYKQLIPQIMDWHKANGGATFNLLEGNLSGKKRFSVAKYKPRGESIPVTDFTPEKLSSYIDKNSDVLSIKGNSLGTWEKEGTVYLDVVATPTSKREAMEFLHKANMEAVENGLEPEQAMYDLFTEKDIYYIPKTHKKLVHFSKRPDETIISPNDMGKGQMGAEGIMLRDYKDLFDKGTFKKRSYFYDEDQVIEARFLNKPKYTIDDEYRIFDINKASQEEIVRFEAAKASLTKELQAKEGSLFGNLPLQDQEINLAVAEELGYDGYKSSTAVSMFHDIKIKTADELAAEKAAKLAPVPEKQIHLSDVEAFPNDYDLTPYQRKWIDTDIELWSPVADTLRKKGILTKELMMDEEGGYLGRIVTGFEDPVTKKVVDIRPSSLFTKSAAPKIKPRIIDDYEEAVKMGYRYERDPRVVRYVRLKQALDALSKQDFIKNMSSLEGSRTFGEKALPFRIERDKAALALKQFTDIETTIKAKVKSGRLTNNTIKALEERNPELARIAKEANELPEGLQTVLSVSEERYIRKSFITKGYVTKKGTVVAGGKVIPEKEITRKIKFTAGDALLEKIGKQKADYEALYSKAKADAAQYLERTRRPALIEEGAVYDPSFGHRIFPKETADYINKMFNYDGNKFVDAIAKAQGVVRMAQTGVDLGFLTLQGLPTMFSNPLAWATTMKMSLAALFKPQTATAFMNRKDVQEALRVLIPQGFVLNSSEMVEAGASALGTQAGILTRIPKLGNVFVRWADTFNFAIDAGRILEAQAWLKSPAVIEGGEAAIRAVVDHLGKKWGVMSTRWIGIPAGQRQVENAVLFYASRWTRSGMAMIKDAVSRGGMEGALARDMLGKLMMGMSISYYGFAQALGQEPNFDPSSSTFMTVEIGGAHVGFGGMYIALARFAGNVLRTTLEDPSAFVTLDSRDNPLLKFVRGRVSPLTGTAIDILSGQTYIGEPVDDFPFGENFLKYVAVNDLTPFWLQGTIQGLIGTAPMPNIGTVAIEFLGARTWPMQAYERRDEVRNQYAQQIYGKDWAELKVLEQNELEKEHEDLQAITQEAWEQSLTSTRPSQMAYTQWKSERDEVDAQYSEKLWELQRQVEAGIKTPYDFKESAQTLGASRSFALEHIDSKAEYADVLAALEEPKNEPDVVPQFEDLAFSIYTAWMYSGDLEQGYDNYNYAEADRRRNLFIDTYGKATYQYVLDRLQSDKDVPPLMQEYYKAQEILRPYWAIKGDVYKIYGTPTTEYAINKLNAMISRLRKQMRATDGNVNYYYNLFYNQG